MDEGNNIAGTIARKKPTRSSVKVGQYFQGKNLGDIRKVIGWDGPSVFLMTVVGNAVAISADVNPKKCPCVLAAISCSKKLILSVNVVGNGKKSVQNVKPSSVMMKLNVNAVMTSPQRKKKLNPSLKGNLSCRLRLNLKGKLSCIKRNWPMLLLVRTKGVNLSGVGLPVRLIEENEGKKK